MRFENILDIRFILKKLKEDKELELERYKNCVRNSIFECSTCRFSKEEKYKGRTMTNCIYYGFRNCGSKGCNRYKIRRSDKKYLSKEQLDLLK